MNQPHIIEEFEQSKTLKISEKGYVTLDRKEEARKDWTRLRMQELLWIAMVSCFYNCLWTKNKENPVGIFKKKFKEEQLTDKDLKENFHSWKGAENWSEGK